MDKRYAKISLKVTDDERARLSAAAKAENLTISEYIRRTTARQTAGSTAPAIATASRLETYHIDDLGPDGLRSDNGALSR